MHKRSAHNLKANNKFVIKILMIIDIILIIITIIIAILTFRIRNLLFADIPDNGDFFKGQSEGICVHNSSYVEPELPCMNFSIPSVREEVLELKIVSGKLYLEGDLDYVSKRVSENYGKVNVFSCNIYKDFDDLIDKLENGIDYKVITDHITDRVMISIDWGKINPNGYWWYKKYTGDEYFSKTTFGWFESCDGYNVLYIADPGIRKLFGCEKLYIKND